MRVFSARAAARALAALGGAGIWLGGALLLGVGAAHAQDGSAMRPPDPPPSSDSDDPGADASAEPAEAEGASSEAGEGADAGPTPEQMEEARARFMQGTALASAGNCEGALAELRASYELVPRASTLYNIAQCEEELNRYDLAVTAYERYLAVAPADAPDRPTVEATMRALRRLLATIEVTTNVEAEVWLGERQIGSAPGSVLVPGGRHVVEIRAEGHLSVRREVEVAAQQTVTIDVTLETAEENVFIENNTTVNTTVERPPLPPAVFWSGVALTLASAGVGGYFGVDALIGADALRNRADPRLPVDTSGVGQSALVADVLYLTALVFGTASLVAAFLTDWDGEPEAAEEGEVQARWTLTGMEVTW